MDACGDASLKVIWPNAVCCADILAHSWTLRLCYDWRSHLTYMADSLSQGPCSVMLPAEKSGPFLDSVRRCFEITTIASGGKLMYKCIYCSFFRRFGTAQRAIEHVMGTSGRNKHCPSCQHIPTTVRNACRALHPKKLPPYESYEPKHTLGITSIVGTADDAEVDNVTNHGILDGMTVSESGAGQQQLRIHA